MDLSEVMSALRKKAVRTIRVPLAACMMLALTVTAVLASPPDLDPSAFVTHEILGRPTDRSMTVTLVPAKDLTVYLEYGRSPSAYTAQTDVRSCTTLVPVSFLLQPLDPDTRYYYRLRYRERGTAQYAADEEHCFHTQRARGKEFRFLLEADPHPYDKKGSHTLWPYTFANMRADSADLLFDLGDTFGDDHNPTTITSEEPRRRHFDDLAFFGLACHSLPLLLCLGNHEGESGYYLLQGPPDNLGVNGTLWRKYYYRNPFPNGFYSGDTIPEAFGIGLPENYYAFEWGDALFVVIDCYRGYTASAKPRGWDWTLGKAQYEWFKQTLASSNARYKFVIGHHTLGETRGGAATATLYEWGGYESNGTTWGFTSSRPGWEAPIHQLMKQNGVSIYFQGHDHLYAKEDVDGIVYQEVPMPSDSTYIIGVRDNGDAYGGVKFDGSGHLRVTVSPDSVKVDYVESRLPADEDPVHRNGRVVTSYTVTPRITSVGPGALLPQVLSLDQNYPNPFNPQTTIRLQIPARGGVTLRVYDLLGRVVAELLNGHREAGSQVVTWDASALPSGVYFYRLEWNGRVVTRKAMVLR